MTMNLDKEDIKKYISVVDEALSIIYKAKKTKDGRRRDKMIREAEKEAQDLVYPYKAILTDICHKEYLNDELFDWGHLESDLQDVYRILTELKNKNE